MVPLMNDAIFNYLQTIKRQHELKSGGGYALSSWYSGDSSAENGKDIPTLSPEEKTAEIASYDDPIRYLAGRGGILQADIQNDGAGTIRISGPQTEYPWPDFVPEKLADTVYQMALDGSVKVFTSFCQAKDFVKSFYVQKAAEIVSECGKTTVDDAGNIRALVPIGNARPGDIVFTLPERYWPIEPVPCYSSEMPKS